MVRSIVPNTTTRRRSLRLQRNAEVAKMDHESGGRIRAASSSPSSTPSETRDGPYRNLRQRAAKSSWEEPAMEAPTASATALSSRPVGTTRSTSRGRKRRTARSSGNTSGTAPAAHSPANKRPKKRIVPSIPLIKTTNLDSHADLPLTRSRQKQQLQHTNLNQITPSPDSTGPTAFSFNSPAPKKKLRDFQETLDNDQAEVVDLYPSHTKAGWNGFLSSRKKTCNYTCDCHLSDCSSRRLTASFIQSYGKEYWQHMKDHEEPIICPISCSSSRQSSHVSSRNSGSKYSSLQRDNLSSNSSGSTNINNLLQSPPTTSNGSDSGSSLVTQETPDRRRNWVVLDTSKLSVMKPTESTKFLEYQPELTPKMRAILMDWIIELSEHFNFSANTLHLAITLIDKVLACGALSLEEDWEGAAAGESSWEHDDGGESKTNCFLIARDRFQLLGATCTWIACKLEEQHAPEISQIAYVSDNIYTVEQIKRMERRICNALHFTLRHQTPYPFIYEFMRASAECPNPGCEASPVFRNMVMYLLEIGRLPYLPVTKKPSLLAASAVYLARVTLGIGEGQWWSKTLEHYTGYLKEDLKDTVLTMHTYHLATEESSLKSVFAKYKSKKYLRVALKTVPSRDALGF